ncbi:MAG: hypothetical protein JWQ70_938 [Aeromicrobium sp.]|nr:hypothetical protein [Aeromicrobium sp.]
MFDLNEPLLTETKAAALLGVTTDDLALWRRQNKGPEWLSIGRRIIRYEPAAISEWLYNLGHPPHDQEPRP